MTPELLHQLPFPADYDRRRFLSRVGVAAAGFFATPGAFAEALTITPRQTEGPFFPDKLPLDTDNDLLILNDSITPAVGEVTYLSGRILGPNGLLIRGATIEIWQCDANGVYLHSGSAGGHEKQDRNFQGYGRFLTAGSGEYLFRTIKPVPYTGRTPHIHAKVRINGRELLTTQLYIKGHPGNEKDMLYGRLRDEKARGSLTVILPRSLVRLPGCSRRDGTSFSAPHLRTTSIRSTSTRHPSARFPAEQDHARLSTAARGESHFVRP